MGKKADFKAVSKDEFRTLSDWSLSLVAKTAKDEIAHGILGRVVGIYSEIVESKSNTPRLLYTLRQAMGITAKSERSRPAQLQTTESQPQAPADDMNSLTPEQKIEYDEITKKRNKSRYDVKRFNKRLQALRPRKTVCEEQIEFDFTKPNEMLFATPVVNEKHQKDEPRQIDRMQEFNKTSGLHSAHDYPKRMDLQVIATEITYKVETVTDPEAGKSVRASLIDDGPSGFSMTWGAIGNLIKMHVGFAIPINRISLMIGLPEFSSGKITRLLQYMAFNLIGVYLCLSDQLADAAILSGDDTNAKVLEPDATDEPDKICDEIDAYLGYMQPRSNGLGDKAKLNVSLLIGKPEKDPRSTIRFFRTHFGSVGNLLTKVLESRKPASGSIIFQGDLSTTNLPSLSIREQCKVLIAGCGAHGRRPFWRYKEEDESLCHYMLSGFLLLSRIENLIDERGRTRAQTLRLRGRYGRMIWHAMRNRCIAATTGTIPSPGTYPKDIRPNVWPPGSELYKAANYIIKHFDALTLYLDHPELAYTNNGCERALRIEKCMLSSSKFRKTKRGRVVLDILRTINATCTAAEVDITAYIRFFFKNIDAAQVHPENFTPFAFAKWLDRQKT